MYKGCCKIFDVYGAVKADDLVCGGTITLASAADDVHTGMETVQQPLGYIFMLPNSSFFLY